MKNITYKIRTENDKLGSRLTVGGGFRFRTDAPGDYGEETAAYAVCRFLRYCPELRDPLILEAVRFGLTLRGCKGRRHRIRTRAVCLGLPGGDAVIQLHVKQGEIVVQELSVRSNRAG